MRCLLREALAGILFLVFEAGIAASGVRNVPAVGAVGFASLPLNHQEQPYYFSTMSSKVSACMRILLANFSFSICRFTWLAMSPAIM